MAELYEEEVDEPTVENLLKVQIVQMQRLYDVSLAILDSLDEDRADQLVDLHSEFKTVGPAPFVEVDPAE